MTDITLRSDMKVELIDYMGGDESIARAARISTGKEVTSSDKIAGLIGYLMRERHGVPFESVGATFRIECPIFVARQLVKHRHSSINETSARYRELLPEFWVPRPDRPLVNVGTSARPKMAMATDQEELHSVLVGEMEDLYENAWSSYVTSIKAGVANEVARAVLPVATYTSLYFTANLRSWFNFLALRINHADAKVESHPQAEIEEVAQQIEQILQDIAPEALWAFTQNGRVAP